MADIIDHLELEMPSHCWLDGAIVWHVDGDPSGEFEVLDEGTDEVSWLYVPYSDEQIEQWHANEEAKLAALSGDLDNIIKASKEVSK